MTTGACHYCNEKRPLRYAFLWCTQRCAAQEAVQSRQRPWWRRVLGRPQ
jgi:hypothetical protein